MKPSTAILIFARTAQAESCAKRLHANSHVNQKIHAALLSKTLSVVKACGKPYFFIDEHAQNGHTFGQRLADAFAQVFAKGYQQVLAIGSDCVALNNKDLKAACQLLSQNNAVVGPDSNHGLYLLGLNLKNFNPERLANLNWQRQNILGDLTQYFTQQNAQVFHLKKLDDVNNALVFNRVLNQYATLNLVEYINQLISTYSRPKTLWLKQYPILGRTAIPILRGPPMGFSQFF